MEKLARGKHAAEPLDEQENYMPAPRWRREKAGGISAPTLWRWRHDPKLDFPACKFINDRLYIPVKRGDTWLSSRPERATGVSPALSRRLSRADRSKARTS
jgi:hypothetical protein